jgi:serine/threonine protein kinase
MAPELFRDGIYDNSHNIDLQLTEAWSMGLTLHQLFCGKERQPRLTGEKLKAIDALEEEYSVTFPEGTDADVVDLISCLLKPVSKGRLTVAQAASHRLFADVKAYEDDLYVMSD